MVCHDLICCPQCGAYAQAGAICWGAHECPTEFREQQLVKWLRWQFDSGELVAAANAWLVSKRPSSAHS